MSKTLTTDEVMALPVSVQLETACQALGISLATGYRLVVASAFPCPVVKAGRAIRVPKTGLLRVLGLDAAHRSTGA
jgi:predicted DNA-binding transcriptional regulator AlpA